MTDVARQVYIISDLHLGGVYDDDTDVSGRGFRICTQVPKITALVDALAEKPTSVELVINGDMVDFLAEREPVPPYWVPFTADETLAADKLERIVGRDQELFDACGRLLQRGHRLTLLLGNHDIELALPKVRQRLESLIGVEPQHDFHFLHDGEAYPIGDAVIEHGNRYDSYNVVDNEALKRVTSYLSGERGSTSGDFSPPLGSRIVSYVINPIKADYRFIDLLKPETCTVIPMLLALEPGYRRSLAQVARLVVTARTRTRRIASVMGLGDDVLGDDMSIGGDIASAPAVSDPLEEVLRESLGDDAGRFLDELGARDDMADGIGEDISAMDTINRAVGIVKLLMSPDDTQVEGRLPSLLRAVRALQDDRTFDRAVEGYPEYLDGARQCVADGARYVVFGHTHLPKQILLEDGAEYLNAGSWADMIRFPVNILSGTPRAALEGLRAFVHDMKSGKLTSWIYFQPTYVRLDLDADDGVLGAALCDYDGPASV